jgi:TrmH family RNA methyltransferase
VSEQDIIRSRDNALLRQLRALKNRAARGERLCLLEGHRLIREALDAGVEITAVAASPRVVEQQVELLQALRAHGASVRTVKPDLLDQISELTTGPGSMAIARRPQTDSSELFTAPALVLAAIGIQDPGNLGALLRTAEAAHASGACLGAGCADPFSWKALRGSMGSALRLPLMRNSDSMALLDELAARDIQTVAADTHAAKDYDALDYRRPTVFVLGNEGHGLAADVRARVDHSVRIPMHPAVESLNVAVAAGVLLFEAARQRRSTSSATPLLESSAQLSQ